MTRRSAREGMRGHLARRLNGEQGIVIIVVMMFCMIFLVLGLALYWLSVGQIRATETERKDVKAFNVAEAGVDAGMLALKLDWPFTDAQAITQEEMDVVSSSTKTKLQDENSTLYDPENSPDSDFLQLSVYDNAVYDESLSAYRRVTEPPAVDDRIYWDAPVDGKPDGKMYVDAVSNVQDDRHRILLVAERQVWNLYFPVEVALFANEVSSNGQGYDIRIEEGAPPVYYDVHDVTGKGISEGTGIDPKPSSSTFNQVVTPSIARALEGIAIQKGTYFTSSAAAQAFLLSPAAGGSVVYIKSSGPVEIAGNTQIGSEDRPVVVVIDTPDGTENGWDMKGSADFWGILVVLGNTTLRGTCSVHGALLTSGTLDNKGNGSSAELYFNSKVVTNVNRQYVLSVNIVANTWEEYTKARGE